MEPMIPYPPIKYFPTQLRQMGKSHLGIIWNDGHHSLYSLRKIRLTCGCALCVDEWTREKRIKEEEIPFDLKPLHIETIGRYALRFDWNDGHSTGYFPFPLLRNLCECHSCRNKSSSALSQGKEQ